MRAKQKSIQVKGNNPQNPNSYQWAAGLSDFSYDVNGHLKQVTAYDNNPRTLNYTSDAYGQVLIREERLGINSAFSTASTLGVRQLYSPRRNRST